MPTYSGMWKKSYEKCYRKFGIRFPCVSVLSESSMSESWRRLFPKPTQTRRKL